MTATLRTAVDLCWLIFIVVWVIASASAKRTVSRPGNQVLYRVFWLAGFGSLYLSRPRRRSIPLLSRPVAHVGGGVAGLGLVIVLGGLALAFWARATLGGNWSGTITLKENHTLVQSGPYGIVRHPIYTAILAMFLGSAITYGTRGAFLAFPVCAVGFILKARQEEALMQQTFPDAYPDYRTRTKMLVPGIY